MMRDVRRLKTASKLIGVGAAVAAIVGFASAPANSQSTGRALKAASVRGKVIGYDDALASGAVQQRFYNTFVAAAKHVGWTVHLADANGSPQAAEQNAMTFVNSGVDALVVSSIPQTWIRPAMTAARQKGIPVILVGGASPPPTNLFTALDAESESGLANAMGKFIIKVCDTEFAKLPSCPVAVQYVSANYQGLARYDAFRSEIKKEKATHVDIVQAIDEGLASPIEDTQKATAAIIAAHPNLRILYDVYDYMTAPSISVLKEHHLTKQVKLYSFYADSVNLPLLRNPSTPLQGVVDGQIQVGSLVAVDQLLAKFSGRKMDVNEMAKQTIGYSVYTKKNAPKQTPPTPYAKLSAPFYAKWQKLYGIGK